MNWKDIFFSILVLLTVSNVPSCGAEDASTYQLRIMGENDNIIINCVFSGKDSNGNGIIEQQELVQFHETEDYDCIHTSNVAGWRAYVDVDSMPMLTHTAEDIKLFKFSVADFAEGRTHIEYHTESKDDFIFDNYHFWRIVKVNTETGELVSYHGIGDGTQGLALSMTDPDSLSFVIEKVK